MGNTIENAIARIIAADIEFIGEKLIIPAGMSFDEVRMLLKRREDYEKEAIEVNESFDVFPQDGAVALDAVLRRRYGFAPATSYVEMGFFGPERKPPTLLTVETGPGVHVQVPWGAFVLPNVHGTIQTGYDRKNGRLVFSVKAKVLRRDELTIRALFDELRDQIANHSIYRGKAIRLRFIDDNGDRIPLPEPKFLETDSIDEAMLILPKHIERMVNVNLFTPITRPLDLLANGIALKRGILLGGIYGTGKTMTAAVASKLAVQAGITYIYIPRADELPEAIQFAKQYQSPSCVIFCEDIDRVVTGDRTVAMDDILNTIDGIDSKTSNIIVVLTTNHMENINRAMLRPGRLDAVIEVPPPDAEAITRLIRAYGKGAIDPDADLSAVGAVLAGNIPAVVAEVVKRAKIAQVALQEPGTYVTMLTADALLDAAHTIMSQVELLNGKKPKTKITLDLVMRNLVAGKDTEEEEEEEQTF